MFWGNWYDKYERRVCGIYRIEKYFVMWHCLRCFTCRIKLKLKIKKKLHMYIVNVSIFLPYKKNSVPASKPLVIIFYWHMCFITKIVGWTRNLTYKVHVPMCVINIALFYFLNFFIETRAYGPSKVLKFFNNVFEWNIWRELFEFNF